MSVLDFLCAELAPSREPLPSVTPADAPVPWEPALGLAAAHDLLPAWWSAGAARGRWEPLPPDALSRIVERFPPGVTQPALLLQTAYEANRVRVPDLLEQGRRILDALRREGVDAVPLKGLHTLLAGWWHDPADRVMRDLDVLVPEHEADRAARCLVRLGYEPFSTGHLPEADHELPAVRLPDRAGPVVLHTALLLSRWRDALPASRVLANGPSMTTTDAVIHSIAHAQLQDDAHLLARLPLRSLHELAVLSWSDRCSEIDWETVRGSFRRVAAEPALDAHLGLARALFGARVPKPSGAVRPRLHEMLCRTLVTRPGAASVYERAVFLPRALSAERMRALHGPGNVWAARAGHVWRGSLRTVRSRPDPSDDG